MYLKTDSVLFEIEKKMWRKASMADASRALAPLVWYISTGRAPVSFLRLFCDVSERQKATIAARLLKLSGGPYDDIIGNICAYLGYDRG